MALPIDALLVVVGLLLATTGVFVYRKALYGFGGLLGAAGGLLVGTGVDAGLLVLLGAAIVGAVIGVWLVLSAYRIAILTAGAISGLAAGAYVAGASPTAPGSFVDPAVLIGLLAGVVAGWLLRKVIVLVVSAAWGASLVSIGIAPPIEDFTNVREIVDAFVSPWLYAVFVGGIAVQVGLWVYLQYYAGDEGEQPQSGLLGRVR